MSSAGRAGGIADGTGPAVAWSRAAILFLLMGGVAYSWLVCTFLSPYAGGADSSGYLNFARLLTHGQVLAPVRALPHHAVSEFGAGTFQPQGFMIRDESGLMAPTYSVGLPLHLALRGPHVHELSRPRLLPQPPELARLLRRRAYPGVRHRPVARPARPSSEAESRTPVSPSRTGL